MDIRLILKALNLCPMFASPVPSIGIHPLDSTRHVMAEGYSVGNVGGTVDGIKLTLISKERGRLTPTVYVAFRELATIPFDFVEVNNEVKLRVREPMHGTMAFNRPIAKGDKNAVEQAVRQLCDTWR